MRAAIGAGKRRIMLQLPTGGGKTLLATKIIINALERDNHCCFTVPALSLINQSVKAFQGEGVTEIGVIQAGHEMTDYSKPLQVASVQTLDARSPEKAKARRIARLEAALKKVEEKHKAAIEELEAAEVGMLFDMDLERYDIDAKFNDDAARLKAKLKEAHHSNDRGARPHSKVVIVDEAHDQFRCIYDWMEAEPDTIFIGLSATPWARGLADWYEELIIVSTIEEMIDDGFLCDFEVYAPDRPDKSKLKRGSNGEYTDDSAEDAMMDKALTGNIVKTWLEKGPGNKTLCFAATRKHAQELKQEFDKHGIRTGYIDMDTSIGDREIIEERFHTGEIQIVFNVGTLTKGVDWDVRCIILARPIGSEMLYVQIVGRVLRTAEGKHIALILDHSATTEELGFVTDIHHDRMRTRTREDWEKSYDEGKARERAERAPTTCPRCKHSYKIKTSTPTCPKCGFVIEGKSKMDGAPSGIETKDGKLEKLTRDKKATKEDKQAFYSELISIQKQKGYAEGWTAHKYKAKFGVWPRGLAKLTRSPSTETKKFLQHLNIKQAKQREKEQRGYQ